MFSYCDILFFYLTIQLLAARLFNKPTVSMFIHSLTPTKTQYQPRSVIGTWSISGIRTCEARGKLCDECPSLLWRCTENTNRLVQSSYTVWVKKKSPPEIFWHFFPNGWEFFVQILHAYYMFLSTLDYKFLFNYLLLLMLLLAVLQILFHQPIFGPRRRVPKSHSGCCSCCCCHQFSKNP